MNCLMFQISLLCWSARNGDYDMIDRLQKQGANIHAKDGYGKSCIDVANTRDADIMQNLEKI